MKKGNLFTLFIALVFAINLISVSNIYANEASPGYFSDDFDDYPFYGGELFPKYWDVVTHNPETGSFVKIEENDGNGFAAFNVKTGVKNNGVMSSVVSVKKNNLNNEQKSLVYEGLFYMFDKYAKAVISFTDARDSKDIEVVSLKGNELGVRNRDNIISGTGAKAPIKAWNKISFVLDGARSLVDVYLNGELVSEKTYIDMSGVSLNNLSLKVAVKNNTSIPYVEGRIHMDNFCIYEGIEPSANEDRVKMQKPVTTYLNKHFTSVKTNGRAHGVVSFYSRVNIIDTPSETNKSADIVLGKDGAYLPFDKTVKENFTAKIIYKSNKAVTLNIKNSNGKEEELFTLKQTDGMEAVEFSFDFDTFKCTASYANGLFEEANFTLEDISYIGFYGEGARLILNKVFAYGGNNRLPDSYFKDYSYQKKAIFALVTPQWRKTYDTISEGIFIGVDFYQASVFGNKLRYNAQPPRVFNGEPYVPVEETAVFLGGEVLDGKDGTVVFSANGNVVELKPEDIYQVKDSNYITAQAMADMFGLKLSWDGEYLLGFGTGTFFTSMTDNEDLKSAVYFSRPSGEEIYDKIIKMGDIHPRIMAGAERIAEVKENINRYPTIKKWYQKIMNDAESYLNAYKLYYTTPDGVRLLSVSNLMVSRMQALGFAYKMTGDKKYAEAAWRDLDAVSRFQNWNPSHFLDVGTMSLGVSIGYSWFYDYLTDEQKDIIVAGFKKCGLDAYVDAVDKEAWWTVSPTNWNPWSHGGVLNALVAMSDRLGDNAKYALDRMFPYLEYLYPEFIPDGAWLEGTSYHAVALKHLSVWCETLKTATGKDYGYWDLPGMDVTAYYGDALSGSGGVFNYGDNTETRADYQAQAWFATKYNDSDLAELRYSNMVAYSFTADLYDILMTRPEMLGGSSTMDHDLLYTNMNLVSMRTSWSDMADGIFLAAKGGENGLSHFHYDLGGFVMDVGGERFAYELGREGYATTQHDVNVYQYKKRAEGHNTYVINPSEDPGQVNTAVAEVVDFQTKERGGYAVIDLTQAYIEARNMKRGFFLTNDRQTMLIQDEVELARRSEVYWFMHTRGDINITEDGKAAYITNKGVTIRMDILDSENADAVFKEMDPLPLETTPWLEGQGRNESYRKIAIHWDNVQKFTLAVSISQVLDADIPIYTPKVVPISKWEVPDGEIAKKPQLNTITRDGLRLDGFSPDKYSYNIALPYDTTKKPAFEYYADDILEVNVIESENLSGVTKFIVKNIQNDSYALYTIATKLEGYIGPIPGAKEAEIVNVTASAEPEYDAGNRAICVIDNDYVTRWTATDDAWIMLELKETVDIYAFGVAWYMGESRNYIYDIEISEDGENWTQVFSGTSSGRTNELECFLLENSRGKYLRYQGHGHAEGLWNNIVEMRVYVK
ncbi:MAG: heparinase II/III family protein [Firmicutes bacterium]|nr:heparinase II/III family protein [Bacillota bacterium]